jgi:putative tryptophan/tyrosine transport system substrate-binding protein
MRRIELAAVPEGGLTMTVRIVVLLLTLVLAAPAQPPRVLAQTSKVYRLGSVAVHPQPANLWPVFERFKARLADRGYVEGKNLTFDMHWAGGDSRIPQLVAELERNGVDVIFALGSRTARITQELVKKTALVVYSCDPFDHVPRLSRQGGNVTGVTCMTSVELSSPSIFFSTASSSRNVREGVVAVAAVASPTA